jgi:hypothetical protein
MKNPLLLAIKSHKMHTNSNYLNKLPYDMDYFIIIDWLFVGQAHKKTSSAATKITLGFSFTQKEKPFFHSSFLESSAS